MGRGVKFTDAAARRIVAAARQVERGNRDQSPVHFRQVDSDSDQLRIGKTSAAWNKGTKASITLWEAGSPESPTQGGGVLADVVNIWANVASGKFVGIQRAANGSYYLVVAEC